MTKGHFSNMSGTYCGWTNSCTTWNPWETIVCWNSHKNHPSRVSEVLRNGFRNHPQYFIFSRFSLVLPCLTDLLIHQTKPYGHQLRVPPGAPHSRSLGRCSTSWSSPLMPGRLEMNFLGADSLSILCNHPSFQKPAGVSIEPTPNGSKKKGSFKLVILFLLCYVFQ